MELVIGGVYQGKLEYAREKYGFAAEEVFECRGDRDLDPSARCIRGYQRYVAYCVRTGLEPVTDFPPETVVLADDIFCGVVPIDGELRQVRDETGRALARIAANAEVVTRIFCGIPQRLK